MFIGRLLKPKGQRISSKEAVKDLWFIDLGKEQDENTRSMTMNGNMNGSSGQMLMVSINGPPTLQRHQSTREGD